MTKKDARFVETVRTYYKENGRHALPWRMTTDPYRILVSEIMLQQTQVDRVVPKYAAFLERFPNTKALSSASLGEVLRMWQGLGYNRRAKMLHACAHQIENKHNGVFPATYEELTNLPGVGPYTASAVMAFAYGVGIPLIETNVRSVYLHHYHQHDDEVHDKQLLVDIARTLPSKDVREWYWALMDYGTYLKRTLGNPSKRSKHYTTQSTFKGSDRQIRGAVIRLLATQGMTRAELHGALSSFDVLRIDAQIQHLTDEEMVTLKNGTYRLP